jgi:hypothetical protein
MLFVLLFSATLNVCPNVNYCVHHCNQIPILEGAMEPFLLLNNPKLRNAQAFVVPQCKRKKLMWASY